MANDTHLEHLSFCDKCFNGIEEYGTIVCKGIDFEMNIPLVGLYHQECYATLAQQEEIPHCTDCVSDPCLIRRKLNEL